jgi:hypothetical protein
MSFTVAEKPRLTPYNVYESLSVSNAFDLVLVLLLIVVITSIL